MNFLIKKLFILQNSKYILVLKSTGGSNKNKKESIMGDLLLSFYVGSLYLYLILIHLLNMVTTKIFFVLYTHTHTNIVFE